MLSFLKFLGLVNVSGDLDLATLAFYLGAGLLVAGRLEGLGLVAFVFLARGAFSHMSRVKAEYQDKLTTLANSQRDMAVGLDAFRAEFTATKNEFTSLRNAVRPVGGFVVPGGPTHR